MRLSRSPTDWQLSCYPSLAVGSDGSLHIVWTECDTVLEGVAYLERTSQGEWLPIKSPFKDKWDRWVLPRSKIEIGKSGNIYVSWLESKKVGYGIKKGEIWEGPKAIVIERERDYDPSIGGGLKLHPSMAIDSEERIHLVWDCLLKGSQIDNHEIYYIEFKP